VRGRRGGDGEGGGPRRGFNTRQGHNPSVLRRFVRGVPLPASSLPEIGDRLTGEDPARSSHGGYC
jgi:hypothetical protein